MSMLAAPAWLLQPLWAICLFIDGIVYSVVAYSYRVFMIVSRINLNVIYSLVSPVIDRVKALIIVFILFKLAVSLIGFLLDPDKANKETSKILKNVIITVALLVTYNFMFSLLNDVSMLLIGSAGDGNEYQVLDAPDDNEQGGLVARLIFGSNEQMNNVNNFGKYLSATTLNIFLYGDDASSFYNSIVTTDEADDFDIMNITDLVSCIGRTVYYRFPLLSTVVGLYLIFCIVKVAIQAGVRAIKLIVLQLIAPIPICSIIQDGTKSKSFVSFYKTYLSTTFELAITVGSMYLVTALIGTFYTQIMGGGISFFGSNTDVSLFTKGIILVIFLIACYRAVGEIPKLLGDMFGGDFGKGLSGFGKSLKTMTDIGGRAVGMAAVGVGGFIAGGIAGSATGVGGAITGALRGGAVGMRNGLTRGGSIADSITNVQEHQNAVNSAGGWAGYQRQRLENGLGISAREISNSRQNIDSLQHTNETLESDNSSFQSNIDDANSVRNAGVSELANGTANYGTFGDLNNVSSASDLLNRVAQSDNVLNSARVRMNDSSLSETERNLAASQYRDRYENLIEDTQTWYNTALNNTNAVSSSSYGNTSAIDTVISSNQQRIDANNSTINTNNTQIKNEQKNITKRGGTV